MATPRFEELVSGSPTLIAPLPIVTLTGTRPARATTVLFAVISFELSPAKWVCPLSNTRPIGRDHPGQQFFVGACNTNRR